MVWQMNFTDDPLDDDGWGWSPDETGMEEERSLLCECNREADDVCCCCGAPLCFMCFETGAGFCAGMTCATEERLAAMDEALRGPTDEEEAHE